MLNDYYITGLQGIIIGFFLGIEFLILLDIISGLSRKHDSFVINFIDNLKAGIISFIAGFVFAYMTFSIIHM